MKAIEIALVAATLSCGRAPSTPSDAQSDDTSDGGARSCSSTVPWQGEAIDVVSSLGDVGLVSDRAGSLHATSRALAELHYVHRPPDGAWSSTTIVAQDVGPQASLALDPDGGIHIAYQATDTLDVKYASLPAGSSTWSFEDVEQAGNLGNEIALAIDATGMAHVVYASDTALRYAYRSAEGSWFPSTVDTKPAITPRLVAAADGLHLVYQAGSKLWYAQRAASWTTPLAIGPGTWPALAVDQAGGVHATFYDAANGDLAYAYRAPGMDWMTAMLDTVGDVGAYTALAIDDAQRVVYIGYQDVGARALELGSLPIGGAFATMTLDTGSTGYFPSLAVDPMQGIHVVYAKGSGALSYGYRPCTTGR